MHTYIEHEMRMRATDLLLIIIPKTFSVQDENSVQVAIRRVMKGSSDLAGSIMIVKACRKN